MTITIDEAIKRLKVVDVVPTITISQEFKEATHLGREALKAWREHRRIMGHPKLWILPGETKH